MFHYPFSFKGRIHRTEYVLSLIVYFASVWFLVYVAKHIQSFGFIGSSLINLGVLIFLLWFILAQGAKRCHDLGSTGWWQLIPLFFLILVFLPGDDDSNLYGEDPKGPDYVWTGETEEDHESGSV